VHLAAAVRALEYESQGATCSSIAVCSDDCSEVSIRQGSLSTITARSCHC
jgi:hypothetical protein